VYRHTPFAAAALAVLLLEAAPCSALAQTVSVVDLPTRPGVTERILFLTPDAPRAAAVLFSGGDGYVGIAPDGSVANGGNFLVRTRALFTQAGIAVAIVDPPSDRLSPPYLTGFRQTPKHVADVRAVIAWLRAQTDRRVWLIGTSRGTQSAAFVGTALPSAAAGGPDGIVLTSTILIGSDSNDRPVPEMLLSRIAVPVLVVQHRKDACPLCPYAKVPDLMARLTGSPRTFAIGVTGGISSGPPCEAFAHHGFNGIETSVVANIAHWILAE
jgi:dienelactone hydrolase